jgi:hypothetical protein
MREAMRLSWIHDREVRRTLWMTSSPLFSADGRRTAKSEIVSVIWAIAVP